MIAWFAVNLMLTLCAAVFIIANGNSPHRLRFHAGLIALICWLVPWPALRALVPDTGVVLPFDKQARTLLDMELPSEPMLPSSTIPQSLFLLATTIGVLLFGIALCRHLQLLRKLRSSAQDGRHLWSFRLSGSPSTAPMQHAPALYLQNIIPGAITTGIFRPAIWVNSKLATDVTLQAVLLHEGMHIRYHDNLYLWLITLAERIFWWNPLVLLLASHTRKLQELSCDEFCADALPVYRDMLSRLVLGLSKERSDVAITPLNAGMFRESNFNVYRIQILKRKYPMKIRHYASTAALVCCTALPIGWVIAQPGESASPEDRARMVQAEAEQRHMTAQAEANEHAARAEDELRRFAAQAEAEARQNAARAEAETRRAASEAEARANEIRDPQTGMTQTEILDGMKVYAANLEAAYLELQEAKQILEQDLERLRADVNDLQTRIR